MNALIDILLPQTCLGCKAEGFFLCASCRERIDEYRYFVCPVCKKRSVDGRLDPDCRRECGLTRYLGAPLPYSHELVKKLIHAFKYQRAKKIATPLSQILCEFLDKNGFQNIVAMHARRIHIAPVPLFDFRARERGFNQATEIAKHISNHYNIPLAENLMRKHKYTQPQADIKDKETRATNVAGAFSLRQQEFARGKTILLVDDVYTSGATMRECALTLRNAGAAEVWGITVAK